MKELVRKEFHFTKAIIRRKLGPIVELVELNIAIEVKPKLDMQAN